MTRDKCERIWVRISCAEGPEYPDTPTAWFSARDSAKVNALLKAANPNSLVFVPGQVKGGNKGGKVGIHVITPAGVQRLAAANKTTVEKQQQIIDKLGVPRAKCEAGIHVITPAGVQRLAATNRTTVEKQQQKIDKLGVKGAKVEALGAASKRAWSKVTSTDQSHWLGKRVKLTKRQNKGLIGTITEVTLAGSLRVRLDGAKEGDYCPCLVANSMEELCTDQP
jgi:hypothetical protein